MKTFFNFFSFSNTWIIFFFSLFIFLGSVEQKQFLWRNKCLLSQRFHVFDRRVRRTWKQKVNFFINRINNSITKKGKFMENLKKLLRTSLNFHGWKISIQILKFGSTKNNYNCCIDTENKVCASELHGSLLWAFKSTKPVKASISRD